MPSATITPPLVTNPAAMDAMRAGPRPEEETDAVVEEFVSSTAPSLLSDISDGAIALTPGAILALLRRRLSDVDRQIDGYMMEIEANTARSNGIQQRVEALQLVKAAMANAESDPTKKVALGDLTVNYNGEEMRAHELLNELGIEGVELGGNSMTPELARRELAEARERVAALQELPDTIYRDNAIAEANAEVAEWEEHLERAESDGPYYMARQTLTGNGLDAIVQQLSSQSRRTNSSNEMLMVQMQSAMQQRGQSVTLATQTLKALNDQMNSIAQNVGR